MKFADQLDRLRRYTTPTVVRAVTQAVGHVPLMTNGSLRPIFVNRPATVGRAVTATLSPVDSARPRAAISADILDFLTDTPGPVIAVVHDATGDAGCIWDKATTQLAASVGCVGIVTDGEATDIVAIESTGLLILANGPTLPNYHVELTDISGSVEVGGLRVDAGDIIHADRHGATVVPEDIVPLLPNIADALLESHSEFLEWLTNGHRSPEEIGEHLREAADRPQSERNRNWWRRS
jgi:regulator of RNase E activity RraA